ncbi:54bb7bce-826b-408a-8b3d-11073bda4045-CDS [Sclerotinia trifoliorum]|uniref:54bb7bce-826b-408a-8b3d-11073bda4045-CDS n=1 Tax=Sclerotinia trifoliorum TaxID=28548 RepID=A0A8H2VXE0_9HELO|nr:54bb7bce-826b-408a-8b3d-11073bda4045-CDS [Sclerotinia trifoliorum]
MSRSPTKRILTELTAYNNSPPSPSQTGIVSLAPSPSSLLTLSAILQCPSSSPPSLGYLNGRWLLSISLPSNYPIGAPKIKFVTRICHPNVKWETGEICLDVLGDKWTPVLGVVGALECVGALVAGGGDETSPLNVEVAKLRGWGYGGGEGVGGLVVCGGEV